MKVLSDLLELIGNASYQIEHTDAGLSISSSTLGFCILFIVFGLGISAQVLRDALKEKTPENIEWIKERTLLMMSTIWFCIMGIIGFSYQSEELYISANKKTLEYHTHGFIPYLMSDTLTIPINSIKEIRMGYSVVNAPSRNGSPTGPDTTGYYLLVDTHEQSNLRISATTKFYRDRVNLALKAIHEFLGNLRSV